MSLHGGLTIYPIHHVIFPMPHLVWSFKLMSQRKVGELCMMIKRLAGHGHPLKAVSTSISCNFKQPSLPLNHFANKHLTVIHICR